MIYRFLSYLVQVQYCEHLEVMEGLIFLFFFSSFAEISWKFLFNLDPYRAIEVHLFINKM